jgi:hypothetical protein
MTHDASRRIHIERLTAAELAIKEALRVVEEAGADVRLTDAVMLLTRAQDYVADFVDDVGLYPPRKLTQTKLDPGNCWQTAWACILDVDPAVMPDQTAIGPHDYMAPLRAYLRKHHNLSWVPVFGSVLARSVKIEGFHVMCGPTVRTPKNGQDHCVVGRNGVMVWDPHPSRAGITEVKSIEIPLPFPREWEKHETAVRPCLCPACAR